MSAGHTVSCPTVVDSTFGDNLYRSLLYWASGRVLMTRSRISIARKTRKDSSEGSLRTVSGKLTPKGHGEDLSGATGRCFCFGAIRCTYLKFGRHDSPVKKRFAKNRFYENRFLLGLLSWIWGYSSMVTTIARSHNNGFFSMQQSQGIGVSRRSGNIDKLSCSSASHLHFGGHHTTCKLIPCAAYSSLP
ncbi:hypothetical protein TNCV_237991 [Trichonephila clavipes]|nr:hypothetical protein TNCV_237991 [Trichonephila clavipes]